MFSCEKCEIFKNTYFEEHLWTTASEPFTLNNAAAYTVSRTQVIALVNGDVKSNRKNIYIDFIKVLFHYYS